MTARTVLQEADITRALTRIAHEILEANKGTDGLVVLGIPTRGVELAERVAALLTQIGGSRSTLSTETVKAASTSASTSAAASSSASRPAAAGAATAELGSAASGAREASAVAAAAATAAAATAADAGSADAGTTGSSGPQSTATTADQPWVCPVGSLDVTMYRDDLARNPVRSTSPTRIPADGIDGKTVVLVDDVLYSGRTIRAALDALADVGRPAAVRLAVLVDRGHRELPIRPDYVGKNLPSAASERVNVLLIGTDGIDAVTIEDSASGAGA